MLNVTMEPSVEGIKQFLTEALLKDLKGLHPSEVVIFKNVRQTWRRKYDDNDLVKIVTANDGLVCKFCLDMAAHNPYRYGDAKRALPHHPKCRCQIRSLRTDDPGYLQQPTARKVGRYMKVWLHKSGKRGGKPAPQRGATIKRLRKKGRRVVAPSGYRAIRIRTR
jgi:hypothetical protein